MQRLNVLLPNRCGAKKVVKRSQLADKVIAIDISDYISMFIDGVYGSDLLQMLFIRTMQLLLVHGKPVFVFEAPVKSLHSMHERTFAFIVPWRSGTYLCEYL